MTGCGNATAIQSILNEDFSMLYYLDTGVSRRGFLFKLFKLVKLSNHLDDKLTKSDDDLIFCLEVNLKIGDDSEGPKRKS